MREEIEKLYLREFERLYNNKEYSEALYFLIKNKGLKQFLSDEQRVTMAKTLSNVISSHWADLVIKQIKFGLNNSN